MTVQPFELRELARTRVDYERGRFLKEAVMGLPGDAKDRIVRWAIDTSQPGIFDPQTTNQLIEALVLAEHARVKNEAGDAKEFDAPIKTVSGHTKKV